MSQLDQFQCRFLSEQHVGSGAAEAEKGGALSMSEGRQVNTTKHFGGGVKVSAGATLSIKAGALSQKKNPYATFPFTHTRTALQTQTHTSS